MKIVTYWSTLMKLAKELGKARKENRKEDIAKLENELKAYEDLVKQSDMLVL